jgi:glucose/arabinose dehydrogenase
MPDDNPFKDKGELAKSFGSVGHRNSLGIALNQKGELWAHEMGPKNGDEINSILHKAHYGSPIVSDGIHYSVAVISTHHTVPQRASLAHTLRTNFIYFRYASRVS